MIPWAFPGHLIFSVIALLVVYVVFAVAKARINRTKAVGFFHPFTNDGGGGERVLWCSVKAIQDLDSHLNCAIYTGDDVSPQGLVDQAKHRFGIELKYPPMVVHLSRTKWIKDNMYPHFTMIGQSIGSIYLALEALCLFTPSVFFDTSGYAFTYPLARLFGCKICCYVHYPTISSDMVSRVYSQNIMYNNNSRIAGSTWLSCCKILYYLLFSWMYGLVGSCAHVVMVNSSWTRDHIEKLWRIPHQIRRVYPPCDISALQVLPLERQIDPPSIISVAQFRPEKAHALQLEAYALVLEKLDMEFPRPKLQFVGSCRNKADQERLKNLKARCIELGLNDFVEFHQNVTYRDLVLLLGAAVAGIHSMIDEHFGISVVEYMAAGVVPIGNNSAGPKMDIIVDQDGEKTGFLASSVEEYADAILNILTMPEGERLKIATAARKRAKRFSEQEFYKDFNAAMRYLNVLQ